MGREEVKCRDVCVCVCVCVCVLRHNEELNSKCMKQKILMTHVPERLDVQTGH
jgi:hypothetical protein